MIVVVTSLSIKKASDRAETVLDAYLTRISAETWMGSISEEGLEDIRKSLAKSASKQTAVSCFRVRGYDRFECAWQIGHRNQTTDAGVACVSQRKRQKTKQELF